MSKERTIDYTIKDHDTFQGRKGTMKKYFQKSSSAFQFIGAAQEFTLTLLLPKPALVTALELKVKDVDQIMVYSREVKIQDYKLLGFRKLQPEQMKGNAFRVQFDPDVMVSCEEIQLRLNNMMPTESIIYYVLVKGIMDEKSPEKKKITNLSEYDYDFLPKKNTVARREREIYERKRHEGSKEKKTNKKKDKQTQFIDLELNNEDEQYQRAVAESLKQQERIQLKSLGVEEPMIDEKVEQQYEQYERDNFELPQELIDYENRMFINYELQNSTSDLEKVFSQVTESWLAEQKKYERSFNVRANHSIQTLTVKKKAFQGMKFWVCIQGSLERSIMNKIKVLGGSILKQPIDNCFAIINNPRQQKKIKGKFGIKWVKPSYITDCDHMKSKLDYKKYVL